MKRAVLTAYLDDYLQIGAIKDYGPQGLQIEGREQVNKVVGMVDAQLPCLAAALGHGADMLLVHHGVFWGPKIWDVAAGVLLMVILESEKVVMRRLGVLSG